MKVLNTYADVPVNALQVNATNDRHGELADDNEAINWMLENLPDRMRKLAKDIANGVVYDPPLIRDEGGYYTVHDGNRRVSTVKLLNDPALAKDDGWRVFFEKLKTENIDKIPKELNCRLEQDQEVIDDIVFRRHAGGASGIGQTDWDAEGKENHMRRTGKDHKPNLAYEWQALLRQKGMLAESEKIPLSNFNRLLSSEMFRSRVGFSFKDGVITFTHKKEKVLDAVRRIVTDLVSREVVLEDIWANKDKNAYLDRLRFEQVLPTQDDELIKAEPIKIKSHDEKEKERTTKKKRKKAQRLTLIPRDLEIVFDKTNSLARVKEVVNELQTTLYMDRHINSISVMFRVLIEMCVDYYNETQALSVKQGDKLHIKIGAALDDMQAKGTVERKHLEMLKKFSQKEEIISAHTFNSYVHSRHVMPSEQHLQAMWDTFQLFVLNCVKTA